MKRKGSSLMLDLFAGLIFIGAVILAIWFLQTYYVSYKGGVETPMENIEALQAAYAVESCLVALSGGDYASSDVLYQKNGKFVGGEDFCNIPYPPIFAEVTDLETGNKWEFTRPVSIADLKKAYESIPTTLPWVWDKIESIWQKQRETAQPKHTIFIPIMFESVLKYGENDVVMESGRKYVLVYGGIKDTGFLDMDDLKVDIYPAESYGKGISHLTLEEIKTTDDLKNLAGDMEKVQTGTEKTRLVVNYLNRYGFYKNIEAGDMKGPFGLASNPKDCGDSGGKKICITLHQREIHGGKLYVAI